MMMIVSRLFALVFLCILVASADAQQSQSVHSRGEYYRGASPNRGYNTAGSSVNLRSNFGDDQSRQFQSSSYSQSSAVNYQQYQPNLQSQHVPSGFAQGRPQVNNNAQRFPTQPALNLPSRFQSDDPANFPQTTPDSLAISRQPPLMSKQTTDLPKPPVVQRFDNITARTINWDGEVSKNSEIFALTLFAYLESLFQDQNIMISPFSIHSLLVLIAEGAGGKTFDELNNTLGIKSKERARDFHQYISTALKKGTSDVTVNQFSAMIGDVNRPIGRDYEDTVEKIFDVDYIAVNFRDVEKTLRDVNNEISQKTNGQIRGALTRDEIYKAQLILMSGVHFQGSWKSVFNASSTKPAPFYDYKQERQLGTVSMMFQRGVFAYTAIQDIGAYILELPYGSGQKSGNRNSGTGNSDPNSDVFEDRVSMIVVLPKKGQQLYETIDNVNKYGMERLFKELRKVKEEYEDDEVEVHLPRFETTTSLNLVEALQNMGIDDLFEQSTADLSKINTNYFVSSILHKTKIRVDEKGTEASAITTSIFQNKATPPVFTANRPFIYFIVDKATRLILFSGAYKKPESF